MSRFFNYSDNDNHKDPISGTAVVPCNQHEPIWLFAYGSLIWNPNFEFTDSCIADADGWTRRFWQGSHDHRGVPEAPGRVVTLIPDAQESCTGIAYQIDASTWVDTFGRLDHREKNGYDRIELALQLNNGTIVTGISYIAAIDNVAFLGSAPDDEIVEQIATSIGPSGKNSEYLLELDQALSSLGIADAHVAELAIKVKRYLKMM